MKFKSILISMLAVAALASCSKEEAGTTTPDTPDMKGAKAFLSVSIKLPKVAGTYAGAPGQDHGTADEMAINKVLVIGFDASNNKVGVYELTTAQQGTIGSNGTPAAHGDAFQVSDELAKIFVVINPTANFLTKINGAANYAAMNQAITEDVGYMTDKVIAPATTSTGFMMTSAGAAVGDLGLTAVTPSIATSESATDINAAKTLAETSPAGVNVDRTMAKIAVTKDAGFAVTNGTGSIDGWLPTATNKNYLPYAELALGYGGQGKYREDANFAASTMADLDWIKNPTTTTPLTWAGFTDMKYVHENTMEAATQAYGNTTKVIVSASFFPTGVTTGDSWFRVGGVIKTFSQLDADYTAAKAATPQNTDLMNGYVAFLDKVLGTGRTKGWTSETGKTPVALSDIEAEGDLAAYKASTANPHMIEFFYQGHCYYTVDINHDEDLPAFSLGRWGVVRNNSYKINVKSISKPGLPFIPDPTDPDIKDPINPKPTDPSDEQSAFISVEITVNPWTTWSQDVDL